MLADLFTSRFVGFWNLNSRAFLRFNHRPSRPWFVASPLRIVLACMLTRLYLILAVIKYANAAFLCQAYVLRVFAVAVICFPMLLCCCLHHCCCAVHGLLIARLCCCCHLLFNAALLLLTSMLLCCARLTYCASLLLISYAVAAVYLCTGGGIASVPDWTNGNSTGASLEFLPEWRICLPARVVHMHLLLCCCCLLLLLFCTAYLSHVFRCYGFFLSLTLTS